MVTTINQKKKRKGPEDVLELPLEGNIGLNIKEEGEVPKEILNMRDDDPRLLKFIEEEEERFRKRHPNQTHEELINIVEAKLNLRKRTW